MNALSRPRLDRYPLAMLYRLHIVAIALMGLLVAPACIGADSDQGDIVAYQNSDGPPDHVEVGDLDADPRDEEELTDPGEFERPDDVIDPPNGDDPLPDHLVLGPDDRPANLLLPPDPPDAPIPVVILLHSYGSTASTQDLYFGLSQAQSTRPFALMLPEGTSDITGQPFWNATSYCCDFYGSGVDDLSYLQGLIDELHDQPTFDVDSLHLVGHSNGGFMAYRLACEAAEAIDSVVALGASAQASPSACEPDDTTSILHIHGSMDAVIYYSGVLGFYPGARTLARRWAERNDCRGNSEIADYIDLDLLIPGNETSRRHFHGCPDTGDVQLWTILGGAHIPTLSTDFSDYILDFSLANPDE